ncbi:nuclease-related domain-containing protein [Streptomyces caniscabiei]|uniref:Nuclease-related domain-containing protein n=1 Tax=Streptomyces caniscabiei TaxID=2746961 RepID=A0ABU4MYI6_9ACTN|nr:nuclease-related domain-containing protein [Streptomyces caniscabiei]MBE4790280.1 NERD domain-containing protein [Streptomyces caniscabiei]MBE4799491.1 NERD domain-containing protein [Streptomyces caniscabiei]MDX3015137.1 nuclease-related domain-containing protein [Streptomyces caniscabiei]MDX3042580.1 nuclease-related domain-containing protein [Streptomyces caniscabiei]
MTVYDNSAARQAAAIRAHARRAGWRWLLARLGVTSHTRRAEAQARAWEVGAKGEADTAGLLSVLEREGWRVLHDRAIPGARSANADHVLVSPGARVFVVDSKLWSARGGAAVVRPVGGRLMHGDRVDGRAIRSVRFEADMVSRALGVPVQPLIAVHRAPVAGQGFILQEVPVVPAGRLVELLRGNDGPRQAGAVHLAQLAADRLPPYVGREQGRGRRR